MIVPTEILSTPVAAINFTFLIESIETSPLTIAEILGKTLTSTGNFDNFLNNAFFFISDKEGIKKLSKTAHVSLEVPNSNAFILPILYSIPVQMLAYHTAVAKGTDVDQPRNLAKSVTVE